VTNTPLIPKAQLAELQHGLVSTTPHQPYTELSRFQSDKAMRLLANNDSVLLQHKTSR
jgi:hypothetical protein